MQNRYKISAVLICIAIFAAPPPPPIFGSDWAFTGAIPGGHRDSVNALIYRGERILSAGDDGFLEIWRTDIRGSGQSVGQAGERFQVSPYRIIAMAGRPERDEVCCIESDGMGLYRVSAWNYTERRNIFTLRLGDPLGYITYSAGGNFIIAARAGRTGLIFLDSATGNILQSPPSPATAVSFAVTGRSERTMLTYCVSGELSYWDLASGNETNHFNVPPNLRSPALFSNNRYLAGVNAEGLAVINAVSGELLAREGLIPDGSLLCPAGDELFCLTQKEGAGELYRYTIDRAGRLVTLGHAFLSPSGMVKDIRFTAIAAGAAGTIVVGTSAGSLALAGMNGRLYTLTTKEQTGITEAAVSRPAIAFLAENGTIGFIPLDYNQLSTRRTIRIEQNREAYNRITPFVEKDVPDGQFVFWHDNNIRTQPVIWSSSAGSEKQSLGDITFRSPIRAADSAGGKILFLDSTGNLTVVSPLNADRSRPFTFFSVGLMDAALVDSSRIIIGRSAVSGNTPFMMININTGETVPLPYPAQAGVLLHRGASGGIYAAAVSPRSSAGETDGTRTLILQLNPAHIADSATLVDFQGEDTQFSLAESPGGAAGSLAATIGDEGAAIYSAAGIQKLDRTSGLPLKLLDGGSFLISLDGDGSICWHDSHNGKLLAIFRLHPGGWTLQTEQRTFSGGLSGS